MDWKLELVAIPVSDVDCAKAFYAEKIGFNVDHDHAVSDGLRFVQLTPPGSACSIAFGTGLVDAEPGSVKGMQIVVADVEAARAELAERGAGVSDVVSPPTDYGYGERQYTAEDPGGHRWTFSQSIADVDPTEWGGILVGDEEWPPL